MGATGNPCDPVVAGGCVGPTECRNKYRIVKEGDIVALPIIPWKVETEASALDAMSKILLDRTTSSELVDSKLLVTLGRDIERADCVPTAIVEEGDVVFFKVESVTPYRQPLYDESDCEVGDCGSDGGDSNSSSESSLGPTTPTLSKRMDKEEAPELGEDGQLGCIINLSVTQVVQAGSVHSAVPYFHSRAYLGLRFGGTPTQKLSHTPYERQYKRCRQLLGIPFHSQAKVQGLSCSILVKGPSGVGKRHLVHTVASELGFHVYELNCHDIVEDSEDQTAKVLRLYISNCRRYTPAIILLRCIEGLLPQNNQDPGASHAATPVTRELRRCLTELPGIHGTTGFPLIVVATSSDPERVLPPVAACFRHEISLEVPDKDTRHLLFKSILAETRFVVSPDINIDYLAQQTASFVARDIRSTVARASRLAWARTNGGADTNDSCSYEYTPPLDACLSGLVLSSSDMMAALASMRSAMSDTLGVPKIPNVKWEDVGGLATAKKDILDTIQLPLESPHLFASGMHTRSGLLFYGPPGTGKTLLAKAVATECGLNFFSVKGPELLNMYIGESEANVRRVFQKAREASPCVVFFDELDSLAPKRGQQGDSGGVMDRVVSQLLAELDGMSKGQGEANNGEDEAESVSPGKQQAHVFVIGATNRPDLLDPALLRPGRFDKLVYLGVSETHDAQLHILKALTRKFTLHPDLKLGEIAEKCPFNYTGADFYALCSDALLKAMLDKVESVDRLVEEWNASRRPAATGTKGDEPNSGKHPYPMTPQYYLDHLATPEQRDVVVERHHFLKALDELVPSVPTEELKRYQALRKQFDAGSKPTTSGVPTRANNLPPVKKGKGKRRAT
ncbi:peroxisomal assembly protein [Spiromyces aspiralis]|uniref:Peroxisomal assembly protein n=1 Tax=Spiromyces aspiralis TaxID=68401 RepID=A0ACC1HFC6_9FUNG|nr:peroxisomal assembly protein [Spiromyces aspiralis]